MIDLHTHSTFSDGSLTPEELVREAGVRQITALALTDHDTTAGIDSFMAACAKTGLDGHPILGVPGVEISVEVQKGTMHMLGYFIDPDNAELEGVLSRIRDGRHWRNEQIVEKLNGLGVSISLGEISEYAGDEVVGRPHFAQALLARGYVRSKQEAFDRFLAKGKPAYVDRFRLDPPESIDVILAAGGIPVLAHPFTLGLSQTELRDAVGEWADTGLMGIEVYYSEHNAQQVRTYASLCECFDLLPTGGSDFHGSQNPDIVLGTGFGNLRVPDEVATALVENRPPIRHESQ